MSDNTEQERERYPGEFAHRWMQFLFGSPLLWCPRKMVIVKTETDGDRGAGDAG